MTASLAPLEEWPHNSSNSSWALQHLSMPHREQLASQPLNRLLTGAASLCSCVREVVEHAPLETCCYQGLLTLFRPCLLPCLALSTLSQDNMARIILENGITHVIHLATLLSGKGHAQLARLCSCPACHLTLASSMVVLGLARLAWSPRLSAVARCAVALLSCCHAVCSAAIGERNPALALKVGWEVDGRLSRLLSLLSHAPRSRLTADSGYPQGCNA